MGNKLVIIVDWLIIVNAGDFSQGQPSLFLPSQKLWCDQLSDVIHFVASRGWRAVLTCYQSCCTEDKRDSDWPSTLFEDHQQFQGTHQRTHPSSTILQGTDRQRSRPAQTGSWASLTGHACTSWRIESHGEEPPLHLRLTHQKQGQLGQQIQGTRWKIHTQLSSSSL